MAKSKQTFIEFLRSFVKKDWVNLIKEENVILIDKEFILEDFKEEELCNLNNNAKLTL
ncbi:hypothetical protein [Tepidibacter formicigenes]|uniref:Uncharacterized protein n=1 Tax=Tepidibacter formicigenes DSM 15518 TaxID=1123349 RepID=A0A1M6N6Q5_9FIRM|nr:hypothetical protein [Tepidibacter formicigenes]SHJ91226.1 hypothetical protein SAMN02744037_01177 [Tepidibacter formicigenes DSM 15518]